MEFVHLLWITWRNTTNSANSSPDKFPEAFQEAGVTSDKEKKTPHICFFTPPFTHSQLSLRASFGVLLSTGASRELGMSES